MSLAEASLKHAGKHRATERRHTQERLPSEVEGGERESIDWRRGEAYQETGTTYVCVPS